MRFKLRSKKTDLTNKPETEKQTASLESIIEKLQNYQPTEGKANFSRCTGLYDFYAEEFDTPLSLQID